VPLAVGGLYTYSVPDDCPLNPQVGLRVLVPLGKKKIYTGIIARIYSSLERQDVPATGWKEIYCFLDDVPQVTPNQLRLWQWMADYYMCTQGEVMRAALPTALKPESETRIALNPDFQAAAALPKLQQRLLDMLADGKPKNIDEIVRQLDVRTVLPSINVLLELGAITVDENVSDRYVPRKRHMISLSPDFSIEKLTDKQDALLRSFLEMETERVERQELLDRSGSTKAVLDALVKKGVLCDTLEQIDRLHEEAASTEAHPLNEAQQRALDEIHSSMAQHPVTLLHGVTSSGKTEVYIHLIQEALARGQQVLYLVPEIALTTQLTDRLRRVFGDRLGVYHSKFSDQERVEIYRNVLMGKSYDVVIGVRSSLFLPFQRLGLIIVDEEHDASYKQADPAPRYHARSAAIMLASYFGAKTLLGTATPAIETYYNALSGKFGLVKLTERYRGLSLPEIHMIDLKEQYRRKEMYGHFSDPLHDKMQQELREGKQVILFQNRRGYSSYLECKECAYIPKCVNCDVSLTEHRYSRTLVCHYCGYTIPVPSVCPACKTPGALLDRGFGTEMIEEELNRYFPSASVARMDQDTTRNKNAHQRLIQDFAAHRVDVLVGTQMVTKGLHFDDVSLVAVMRADQMLNMPDFRASERAYQMLEQVAGRAGRTGQQGEVFVQASDVDNPVYGYLQQHDYEALYHDLIRERQTFHYPPFHRIIELTLRHHDQSRLETAARTLQERLRAVFGMRCSTVIVPVISRVQNQYSRSIVLKIEATASFAKAKEMLLAEMHYVQSIPQCKGTMIIPDVDPM